MTSDERSYHVDDSNGHPARQLVERHRIAILALIGAQPTSSSIQASIEQTRSPCGDDTEVAMSAFFYRAVYRLGFTPWERLETLPAARQALSLIDRE